MATYRAKLPQESHQPCHTVFIGHNPSLETWSSGHFFANPSNRFWSLLEQSGIVQDANARFDDVLVQSYGYGFCDVIEQPGNNANDITPGQLRENTPLFLNRIEKYALSMNGTLKRLCFVGKRQWKHLFHPALARCDHGLQQRNIRPPSWPSILSEVEVWILPSPSGRAVLSKAERLASYLDLAGSFDQEAPEERQEPRPR